MIVKIIKIFSKKGISHKNRYSSPPSATPLRGEKYEYPAGGLW